MISCKSFNDNPAENNSKIKVDISKLQQQLGYSTQSKKNRGQKKITTRPGDSDATVEVKALLIGALIVNSRTAPYNNDLAITDEINDQFQEDMANSTQYFSLVSLPVAEDFVEFMVPTDGAGNWQVMVIGLDFQPDAFEDLGADERKNSSIYFGFTPIFYTRAQIGDTPIEVKVKRQCLIDEPPKGCATYDDKLVKKPIVTASVEIIDVKYNGDNSFSSGTVTFPIIVRNQSDADSAITSLETIVSEIGSPKILTVFTTHTKNSSESTTCQNLANVENVTVAQLSAACQIQESKMTF